MIPSDLVLAQDVMPLGHLLLRSARRDPGHEALVFPDARFTYRELADRAWDVARSLLALGVQPRDHVGLLMTNHPDLVTAFFGISLVGGVVVPLNARYRTAELATIVDDAGLALLLTHDNADAHVDFSALIQEAVPDFGPVVMLGAREDTPFMTRREFDALEADEEELLTRVEGVRIRDAALMLYTSGTTSQPRGAIISHEAYVRGWVSTAGVWGTGPEDRQFTALPLYHVTALGCMTWELYAGGTFISDYSWDAGRALKLLEAERVTEFYPAYQPVMEDLLSHPDFAKTDLSRIRRFLNVAPPEVLAKFQKRLPHAIQMTVYGGTEGGQVTLTRPDDPLEVRLNTCGSAPAGIELRVVDEAGNEVAAGTPGVIQFRGWNTLTEYHRSPVKNAESLLPGGWVTMQDLGVLDAAGHLLFLGRVKETLKVGGENVAPQEVEAHLCTHPAVKLAQVVGMPDDRLLEVPAAFVELQPGVDVDPQELIDHCRGKIASFKVPRLIRFIDGDEWPMSTTKIQRFALKERLLEELKV
jgi:fatty-acyl-CoA synthase